MNGNKKFLISGAMVLSLFFFSSCALFLVGAGAAGGYAISKDTIEGIVEKPLDKVWSASRDIMMYEGFIRLDDKMHGKIEGEVRKSQVDILVTRATEKTIRIQVKARKDYKLLPDPGLANELYNKIYQKIK